jgi:RNA-directed DNA polymerase
VLFIRQVKHLAMALKATEQELVEVLDNQADYIELLHIRSNGKVRQVVNVTGTLRKYQKLLYRNVLLPKLQPSKHSHGGIAGRSILTNVAPHIGQRYLFSTDISSFYRNIHHTMIYRLFLNTLKCSPDVARLCTRLTTFNHHLALGFITSPILANQLLGASDVRIASLCEKNGMTYTRFVDDISISAPFDLGKSGFATLVERILNQAGFHLNRQKHIFGRIADGVAITKLRIVEGHPDVELKYLRQVWRELLNAEKLSKGHVACGVFLTRSQMLGKIQFIAWVNASRKKTFIAKFKRIDWTKHREEAMRQGILTKQMT